MKLLAETNRLLETGNSLPTGVWNEFLWDSPPDEPVHPDVLLNRNQLLGLLVCRFKSISPVAERGMEDTRMTVVPKPVAEMSLRELKDSVANLQLEWPRFLERIRDNPNATGNLLAAKALLERLVARFGELAWGRFGEAVLDDQADTQPWQSEEGQLCLTPACLRRLLGTFQMFYRHLYLLAVADTLPRDPKRAHQLTKYHYEASMDTYHTLCMFYKLPVAAVLNYRNDFPGMYNHVRSAFNSLFLVIAVTMVEFLQPGVLLPQQPVHPHRPLQARRRDDGRGDRRASEHHAAVPGDPSDLRGGPVQSDSRQGVVVAAGTREDLPADARAAGAVLGGRAGDAGRVPEDAGFHALTASI